MPANPKHKRIKLSGPEYAKLRREVAERALWRCERCEKWIGMNGDLSHSGKSRGAGGDDSMESNQLEWLCRLCHDKLHRGL